MGVGANPAKDTAHPRVQRLGERTAAIGSNLGILLEWVSSDGA